jgi:phospholipid transport system substrate-binding protein
MTPTLANDLDNVFVSSTIMKMFSRPLVALVAAALALTVAAAPVAAAAQALPEQAKQHIQAAADRTTAILARDDMSPAEQAEAMRPLLHEYFGVEEIGAWVVGRYWRGASEPERQEFLRLFEDFVLYAYAQQFQQYGGEQLRVQNATAIADDTALVESVVVRPAADTNPRVTWRVTRADGALQIRDVTVEGVSMAQTQRSDFTATIQQRGGTLAGLNDALGAKVSQLKAEVGAPN